MQIELNNREHAIFKSSTSDKAVLIIETFHGGGIFLSDGGRNFHEVKVDPQWFDGDNTWQFEDPSTGETGQVVRRGNELSADEETYNLQGLPLRVEVERYFGERKIEDLFTFVDGSLLYVSAGDYRPNFYDSFRVFVGRPGEMREITTGEADRCRHPVHGSETTVETDDGFVNYGRPGEGGWWVPHGGDPEPLESADPSAYLMQESAAGLTITDGRGPAFQAAVGR